MNARWLTERYDVALSLHGGDEGAIEVSEQIVQHLQRRGLRVFYYRDRSELERMLGRNLEKRLQQIYSMDSHQVVLIASPSYAKDGFTTVEWEAISRRRQVSEESFLLPVSVASSDLLDDAVAQLAFVEFDPRSTNREGLETVVNTVARRLGQWPRVKAAIYYLLLGLALASIMLHWFARTYVGSAATATVWLTVACGLAWLCFFRIAPRLAPRLVYAPRNLVTTIYQHVYLSPVAERMCFAVVLAAAVVAHTVLPSVENEIKEATTDWLGDVDEKRAAAILFFQTRVDRTLALDNWFAIAVDEQRYEGNQRGKAIDAIWRLQHQEPAGEEPVLVEMSPQLRQFGEAEQFGLSPDTWPSTFSAVDFSNLQLNHVDFSRLHFAGKETNFRDAELQQGALAGTYFQATNFEGTDIRWSDFSLASFLGAHGDIIASGATLPGATFFGCDLADASFFGADLTGVQFLNCTLTNADFTNAYMSGVRFEDSNLDGARFTVDEVRWNDRWGDLACVTFLRCQLRGTLISGADFTSKTQSFYRVQTPDPSNLNATVYNYARDSDLPTAEERERVASIEVPATAWIECTFDPSTSFADTQSSGMFMDRSSYRSLSTEQRADLTAGGWSAETLLEEIPDESELVKRFPALIDKTWDRVKDNVLDVLFDAAETE